MISNRIVQLDEKYCDTHVHAFGPIDRFPLIPNAVLPPQSSVDDYLEQARPLSISRSVFVQPSTYGFDNEAQLQAVETVGADARAIVSLPSDISDVEIAAFARRGAIGARLSATLTEPPTAERLAWMEEKLAVFDSKLCGSDWCIELLVPSWMTVALLPTLRKMRTKFVLCHGGMFPARLGVNQPGFLDLLRLMEKGLCWIKLTGVLRWSEAEKFEDTFPLVHALSEIRADRLVWGTDYPNVGASRKITSAELLALLGCWFPTEAMRQAILVDNPQKLYGFAP